ncbi:hypothetical protein K227x_00870 [Rubripirellula lacrimiformis]|uniref:Uncharacterized protein n=1 Tax=Rubripirellula lacrimiformis TaxID=1930273 RepID=A0A517N3K6_9BACT|nr:hypothetical protein [Rubripirellula lacrimiformis]QDT01720.1 hypothetical protein K227x_00870 [Rubripirellula lacrimiformis]
MNPLTGLRSTAAIGGSTWLLVIMVTSAWSAESNREELPAVQLQPAPAELSVAPLDHIEYPDDRPEWLDDKPTLGGDEDRIVVVSSACDHSEDALEELRWMQRAAVATYVSRLVGSSSDFDFYQFTDDDLDQNLISQRYLGEVMQGDSTKYEAAVELRFDSADQDKILAAWKNVEVADRLKALGGLTSLGLVVLMCTGGLIGVISRRYPNP